MKSEVRFVGHSVKFYISVGLFATILVIWLTVQFTFEVSVILYSIGGSLAAWGALSVWVRFRLYQDERRLRQIELGIKMQSLRQETFKADKLLLESGFVAFSRNERVFVAPGNEMQFIEALPEPTKALLPAVATTPPNYDLMTVFTQPTQSYAIIGGQQVGKTYQAQQIAAHWLGDGITPWVIGPKWDVGEWPGCKLFGGEYNFNRVSAGMDTVRDMAQTRHANKISHKAHPIQPVFFDDWTAIRAKLERDAEAFIIDATTLYASVNIILYFIIHLDTANAWGVGRVGAALHQNFIKLRLYGGYDGRGLIDRTKNYGYLIMPGQSNKERVPVALLGNRQVVVTPSADEARILEMYEAGDSYNQIALAVWGNKGGVQNDKIKAILARWGRV